MGLHRLFGEVEAFSDGPVRPGLGDQLEDLDHGTLPGASFGDAGSNPSARGDQRRGIVMPVVFTVLPRAFPGDSVAGPRGGDRGRSERRPGRTLAAALLMMTVAAPPAAADRLDRELRAAVDGVANSAYAVGGGRRLHVPGVVLAVRAGGRTRVVAAGSADLRTGRAMRPNTRQPIGSVSKVFTAVLTMRLVERGQIHLNDTVPEIAAAHNGDGGRLRALVAAFEPRLRGVTVRDLLAMTKSASTKAAAYSCERS